ncbi:MAG: response regulator [Desulfobulbaceae bacterium]|nr:response regulator [Desulfobulbaceae bacterium]
MGNTTDNSKDNELILVVEDEGIIALDIQSRLMRLGYNVPEIAVSGEAAVALARKLQPDLVLMDITLSGAMDGVEAAAKIKELWDTPIVFLTANADDATFERAKNIAPHGYVLKPFEERELHIAIDVALYKSKVEKKLNDYRESLESILNEREMLIVDLRQSLKQVKILSGLLPICASCKKIRDDKGYWNRLESYLSEHSNVEFSHSVCPDCVEKLYPELHLMKKNHEK